jgi:hypothetical protein
MWIYTIDGFFSVVMHNEHPNQVMVKARNRAHLERVIDWINFQHRLNIKIIESQDWDFVVRAGVPKSVWADYLKRVTNDLDYTGNVKGNIMENTDPELGHAMFDVWDRMVAYQREVHPDSARDLSRFG